MYISSHRLIIQMSPHSTQKPVSGKRDYMVLHLHKHSRSTPSACRLLLHYDCWADKCLFYCISFRLAPDQSGENNKRPLTYLCGRVFQCEQSYISVQQVQIQEHQTAGPPTNLSRFQSLNSNMINTQ